MRILLISENVTIQKLFKLSAEKRGDEIEVGSKDFLPEGEFDLVFIDKDILDDELLQNLKNIYPNAKFILILSKNDEKVPGFDYYLTKPFLPTDLIDLIEKTHSNETAQEELSLDDFDDDLDIESLNDLDLDEGNDESDDIGDIEDIFVDDEDLEVETLDEDLDEDFELNADDLLKEDEEKSDTEVEESFEETNPQEENIDIEDISEEDVLEEKPDESIEVEDILEEKALEDELEIKEEVDEDIAVNEEALEDLEEFTEELEESEEMNENMEIKNEELEDSLEEAIEEFEELEENETNEENIEENVEEVSEELPEESLDLDELDELEKIDEKELAQALGEEVDNMEEKDENINMLQEPEVLEQPERENKECEPTIEEKTLGNILNINWEELKKAKAKVTITIDFGG